MLGTILRMFIDSSTVWHPTGRVRVAKILPFNILHRHHRDTVRACYKTKNIYLITYTYEIFLPKVPWAGSKAFIIGSIINYKVKLQILSVEFQSGLFSKKDLTRFKLAQMSCEECHARIVRPSDNRFIVRTKIEREYWRLKIRLKLELQIFHLKNKSKTWRALKPGTWLRSIFKQEPKLTNLLLPI